jgi:iron complex outermembrane receptor protein
MKMNLKNIILFIVCIFASNNIFAQNKISGNIKDKSNNENLPGVSIYIADLKTGASTDIDGNYQIENLKPGNYLINISYIGYKSINIKVRLSNDTLINFKLRPSITEMNDVIVTGVTRSTVLKLNPIVVKTIDRDALSHNSSTNLIDGLKNIPCVNQITTGAAISKPVIRGLGYNRVITLNNGIKQEGQQWGDEHGIEIDEYSIDRVEIVKGPGSLMYGSDGIAGVLNFLAPKTLPIGTTKTQLISNYQTNNNLIGYSLSSGGNNNGFQWSGRFSNKFAGDYQNAYDGKVYNSGFREFDGSVSLGINKNWGYSHFILSSFNQTINMIEGERDSLGNFTYENSKGEELTAAPSDYDGYHIGFPHQEINHIRAISDNYLILNKGTINMNLGFQNNKRKEFGDPTQPNDKALYFYLNTFNYNIIYNFEKTKGWETSIGIGGMQQSNTNKGLEFLIPNYHLFDAGIFVFTQKNFNKLTFAGGFRFDNRNMNTKELYLDTSGEPVAIPDADSELKFNSFTKNYNGISGSLGLSYQINTISTLKLNLSRGFRAPNIAELSSNGRHEGTFRYEIGEPNLKSEISHQIDIAYYLNSDHVSFSLTPFVNFIGNYIYSEKLNGVNGTDSIPDPSEPAPAFKFASGNATLLGGEIYLDIHPHPLDWLHIENSFSYVQATQNNQPDSSKYLPFIPAPKYRGVIKAQFKNLGKTFSNVFIKFSVDHFFQQDKFFSAYGTETGTPAYTLISAGLGGNIKAFKHKDFFSLYITGENLADVAYQNHLSRLKYAPENLATGRVGVYNMGRNISVKLIMNF